MSLQYRIELARGEHHSWYVWRVDAADADKALQDLTAPLIETDTPHRVWRRAGGEWLEVK